MRTFLFLLASARPDGNTEALARHAADGLPAGTPQRWLNLTEFPLPAFENIRHTPGVRYAEPSGNERVLLDATMAASDLVVASATGPVRCATTPMRWPKAPAFFASSVAEGAPQTAGAAAIVHAGQVDDLGAAFAEPSALAVALDRTGYLPDEGLATAAFLALRMHRPLFLEGDAGVGKTSLAQALATVLGARLVRLQCYEGIDAAQALYDWDFPRQVLHLRAAETAGQHDAVQLERSLYDRRFLVARPILQAIEHSPSVLLVDEIDRADDEFEAFLLEVLADNAVTVPEIGTIRAETPPVVVLTSNRTREVHDALKRRCLYHWVPHPSYEREVTILRRKLPDVTERLAADVARATARLRTADLQKPPGVAESIDWAHALHLLGARELDLDNAAATLGAVLKYHEDSERIRDTVLAELIGV